MSTSSPRNAATDAARRSSVRKTLKKVNTPKELAVIIAAAVAAAVSNK